jgi:3-oxoacyl-[acyl-carrier protein] reductase
MELRLDGRTALITGGSRGLGFAIANRFAASGAEVIILARRQDVLEGAVNSLRKSSGGRVLGYPCDVSNLAQIETAMERIFLSSTGVDILVNNAGSSVRSPVALLTTELLQSDLNLKLVAAVQLSQFVIPRMKEQRWGRIINVVSVNGKAPPAGGAPTALSRAAGITLTKVMANELAPHNILVNALCVGYIDSDQWRKFHQMEAPKLPYGTYLQEKAKDIPLGRLGTADEFASVACFLASDAASYVTGTAINVDGGRCPVV